MNPQRRQTILQWTASVGAPQRQHSSLEADSDGVVWG